ncbi:MAG: phosphoadenylyl-sulfate reductase [Dehalococcoidia bacterium]|nr:phosphoadenylyl-sulfate reductase [Dehalococcoidia bacterium]HRC61673.1 phosphoadenylyl-sulfate reductase [Dehalococcoidia bacterium]
MTTETKATEADPRELAAIEEASIALDQAEPEEILRWAIDRYGEGLTLACSFGGISGMVLMDMVQNLAPSTEVFYLDTDYLFPETYEMVDTAKAKWVGANIVGYRTDVSTEEQARIHGANLWERDPDLCCEIRKVEPNRRALDGKAAWISGLRRDQSTDRGSTPAVQWDAKFGLVKVNPLINWDEKKVWAYIFKHSVPYNPLHDRGYPSIGCTNCTKPVKPGDDPRSGRWSGMDKDECGLHTAP